MYSVTCFRLFVVSLIDLGDKNDTKLKSSFDIVAENVASGGRETVEAAQITTMQMAEQAGEISVKVTEIIYVHSKLMIIDDRMAI
ncbi:unnamed protein product [Rotaria sp. Silwood1]|nr:unnamed protein product [Rotaria sp. Silwood1]